MTININTNESSDIDLSIYNSQFKELFKKDLNSFIKNNVINILYIGTVIQKDMLGPFLNALKDKFNGVNVNVYQIYNTDSTGFIDGPFKNVGSYTDDELQKFNSNFRKKSNLNNFKINKGMSTVDEIEISFDVIFCCFEMQYALNWRYSLLKILTKLKNGGLFYFAELGGDISIMDGHFGDLSEVVEGILPNFIDFKKKRNELYYWNPEISISNYKEMAKFLWKMFDDVKSSTSCSVQKISLNNNNLKENYKNSFTFLSHGLDETDDNDTKKSDELISNIFKDAFETSLNHSFTLYSSIGYNKAKSEKIDQYSIRLSNALAESLKSIDDYSLESICKKFLQLCEQHDLLFPEIRIYEGIFIPENIDSVVIGQLITKKRISVVQIPISPSRVLFEKMKINVPVLVVYVQNKIPEIFRDVQLIEDFKQSESINDVGLKVKRNNNGEVDRIYFFLCCEESNEQTRKKKDIISIKEGVFNEHEKDMKDGISLDNIKTFIKLVGAHHFGDKKVTKQIPPLIITYFPASIKSNNKSQHLGSIFIKEKLKTDDDQIFISLIEARNDILSRMSDYILHRMNLVHSLDNFKRHARRAAIAAISARNVSHNIGSHVIPSIKKVNHGSYLSNILQSGSAINMMNNYVKKYLKTEMQESINAFHYYDDFLDYVSQRNDFVNQLTSTNTNWSISVWFVRELMAKFMNQYFLLNSIGEHEGLKAYDFNKYRKSGNGEKPIDGSYYDYSICNEQEDVNNVLVYGNISINEKNLYIEQKVEDKIIKIEVCNESWIKKSNSEIRFNNSLPEYDTLLEILKDQSNRKIRLIGDIKYTQNEDKYILRHGCLVDGNIIIKVRLRNYKLLEENGNWSDSNYYSEYLGVKDNLIDLMNSKYAPENFREGKVSEESKIEITGGEYDNKSLIEAIKEKTGDSHSNISNLLFYGIIVGIVSKEHNKLEILVWNKKCYVHFEKKLPDIGTQINPGDRIVFSSEECKNEDDKIIFSNSILKEISVTQHLLTTNPNTTSKDIFDNDVKVSIPGGISGYQSFYTILENVIRNAVKHNWVHLPISEKIGRNLEVKIDLSRIKGIDHYIIKIWTNLSDLRYPDAIVKYDKNHKRVEPDATKNGELILTHKLNNIFKSDIIKDNTGDFVRSDLGSTETKINAAYLFNSNKPLTENRIMKGEDILLKDKTFSKINKGYIRASHIYEHYKEEIVPKLGIRFKICKPVELTTYDYQFEETDDTIQQLSEGELKSPSNIRGDIFLFVIDMPDTINEKITCEEDVEKNEFQSKSLLELTEMILSVKNIDSNQKNSLANFITLLEVFSQKVEEYPYRLVCTIRNIKSISELIKALNQFINQNKEFVLLKFFLNRVLFIKQEEINQCSGISIVENWPENISSSDKLKLFLYDKWISQHQKKVSINIQIYLKSKKCTNLENGQSFNTIHIPSQYPEIGSLCNEIPEFLLFPMGNQNGKNNISYTRHGYDNKYSNKHVVYCENLTGSKLSYNLFSIFASNNEYNKLKLKLRLKENGLLKYLILDERLMKFIVDRNEKVIRRFNRMGIAIPHFFQSDDGVNPKVKLDYTTILQNNLHNDYFTDSKVTKEFDRMSIEYLLPYNEEVEHNVINTIIIHQSILEKMVEEKTGEKVDEMDRIILSFKKIFPSVLITSGRNKSAYNLSARFLPFSVVEELLYTDNPDKIIFTEIILKTSL